MVCEPDPLVLHLLAQGLVLGPRADIRRVAEHEGDLAVVRHALIGWREVSAAASIRPIVALAAAADVSARVEAIDVGIGRVPCVVPRIVEPRRMVEHVAHDGRGPLVLPAAYVGEALGARVERNPLRRVVRVQLQDMRDGRGREAEACAVRQVVAQVSVGVDGSLRRIVRALVRVGPVEVRDVGEAAGVEELGRVVGDDVSILHPSAFQARPLVFTV